MNVNHEKAKEKKTAVYSKDRQSAENDFRDKYNRLAGIMEGLQAEKEGAEQRKKAALQVLEKGLSDSLEDNEKNQKTRKVVPMSEGLLERHYENAGIYRREQLDGFELAVLSGAG